MPFREDPPGPAPASVRDLTRAETSPVWVAVATVALLASGPAAVVMLTRQIAPVLLSDAVSFATPAGCTPDSGVTHPMPAQRTWTSFDCAGLPLTVTTQVFPPRSTSDRLVRERRRITGELTAGEAVVSVLPTLRSENGAWSLIRTTGPARSIAVAGWVDGVPAQAGIAGRIRQARNSLFGSSYAPILITAAMGQATRPTPAEQQRTNAILSAFVDAQTNLTSGIAAVSQTARP